MSSQSQKSQALLSLWGHLVLTSIAKQTHTHTHTHTHCEHTPGAVGSHIAVAPGEQLGVWCLAQGSHLSHGIEGGREHWLFTPKSKWLDNWDCLGFWVEKKEWIFIIRVVSNQMSHLKLKYYNLNSRDEGFRKSGSYQCWVLL